MAKAGFSEQLAARCVQAQPTAADINKAKLCLFDYFACALAGSEFPWSRAAATVARHSPGLHAVVGHDFNSTEAEATFANAVLGHSLVRDDMHLGSVSHLGTVIIPTLLALAPGAEASGKDLLTAMVAGYEAGGTLGKALLDVEVAAVHRPTGLCGPVAAAAAGAHLLRYDVAQTAAAIGLAANTAAGYNEWAATGGSEMFFQVGYAARNGLLAVRLAAEEPNISRSAIDGPAGMLAAFDKAQTEAREAPSSHEIRAVFFKEVPACNFAQTPAQAAKALIDAEGISAEDIDKVVVFVNHAAAHYPGCDAPGPLQHVLQAKMSIQYNVAAALLTGNFSEENFRPQNQQQISELAESIELRVDPLLTAAYPRHQSARVRVDLRDGRRLSHSLEDVQGADERLVERRFVEAALGRLGSDAGEALALAINALPSAPDCRTLTRLCRSSQ